jgi:hypothetical protein
VLTASDLNIRNPFEVKVRNKSRDQRHARGNLEKKREEKHASKRHGAEFFFFSPLRPSPVLFNSEGSRFQLKLQDNLSVLHVNNCSYTESTNACVISFGEKQSDYSHLTRKI